MGIRVNKILGYGLTDVIFDKHNQIIDPRFDSKINQIVSKLSRDDNKDYLKFLKHEMGNITYVVTHSDHCKWDCSKFITLPTEYDEDNKIFMLTHSASWFRHDDIIDYTIESERYNQTPRIETIKHGVFPYSGTYVIKSTGKQLTSFQRETYTTYIALLNNNSPYCVDYGEKLQVDLELHTIQEILTEVVPIVPKELQLFCRWLNIFSDNKYILHLKPLCYTYWC